MSEFAKYEDLHSQGVSAHDVYLTAKADGVDAIRMIRLLRHAFGLSLAEAKQVTEATEAWSAQQKVVPGATVYWEGWSTEDGFYLMQARIKDVVEGSATLEGHRKFKINNEGLVEVPVDGPRFACMKASAFEQPLSVRVEQLLHFVEELSHLASPQEGERKAV